MTLKTSLLALSIISFSSLRADVRLPRLFADNMVIQRDKPVAIWGWADPGEKVTIRFEGQVKASKADKKGHWSVYLDPVPAGGPFRMTVQGKGTQTISISNILAGEVWICSGQSNMEFQVKEAINAAKEIENADYPQIRQFDVPNLVSVTPREDLSGGDWQSCNPGTAGSFTAVGYFFARELYRKLHVPIGLINTTWGGTMVETWTSKEAFEQNEEFKTMITTLPKSEDMAKAGEKRKEEVLRTVSSLQGGLPSAAEAEQYKDAAYDDSRWAHMKLPGVWEQAGLGLDNLDGIVWFRKEITIAGEDAGKPATIELSKIDDSDDSYVNGVKVGSTKNRYAEKRIYAIPAGVLKAGKNIIAIRVEDTGGAGGVYGEPEDMKLTIAGKAQSLAGDWSFRVADVVISTAIGPNSAPTLLFNGMVNPLVPYTIKGAIWYQGEANAGRAFQYRKAFPLMITDWRSRWKEGDFPFYFVQLATYNASNGNSLKGSTWAELREAQTLTLSLPATGMSVTTDIGDPKDIHPRNKQDVGLRLAAIALHNLYGDPTEYNGPMYQSLQKDGDKMVLSFTHTGSGLVVRDQYGYLKGFEIAGADRQFHYAKARVEDGKVIVWQDGINDPVAVRYGWADNAEECNLFNKEGFPASPFRTDQWPGATDAERYAIGK